ncbi:lanthionine synthetase LanC family protein [Massilia sp. CT11-108]
MSSILSPASTHSEQYWTLSPASCESALELVRVVCTRAMEHDFSNLSDRRSMGAVALLLAVASNALQENAYGARGLELMDDALAGVDLGDHSLFSGATGLVWKAAEVDALLGMNEYASIAADYDESLSEKLSGHAHWPGHYELINGLTGIGVYAFARRLEGHGGALQEQVLKHLRAMATWTDEGCCWVTTRSMLAPGFTWPAASEESFIDLGIAHGNAGVISLLAAIVEQEQDNADARALLAAAVSWYTAQQRPDFTQGVFGYRAGDQTLSRGAWCYGDFSAAWALLCAGRALDDSHLNNFGLNLLRQASARTGESLAISDPWFCHGYAGLSHLARRAASIFQETTLMVVAQRYFELSLDLARPLAHQAHLDWSLLEGIVGNCLCYLDTCGLIQRRWDRQLLVS